MTFLLPDSLNNCYHGSLDPEIAKDKIVVCSDGGGRGMIVMDDLGRSVASNYGTFPSSAVTSADGDQILSYIKSTRYTTPLSASANNYLFSQNIVFGQS